MNDRLHNDFAQVFEQLARSRPDAPALHVPGRPSLSYADLNAQIHYLRDRLGAWGYTRGDVIAGVIPLRPEMAVTCAALPAAATFAPLSPSFTEDVYAELLTRLRAKAVIVPAELEHPVRTAARRCGVAEIALIANPIGVAGAFTLDVVRHGGLMHHEGRVSEEFAYVMSTSGTTGSKKLVPVGQRHLIHYSRIMCDWFRLSADDLGCHLQPLHLGSGVCSTLMVPLLGGAPMVCLPESDADAFLAALDQYRLTWLTTGFTVHRAILERAPAHRDAIARSRLRFVRASSGRLEIDEIDAIERLFRAPLIVGLSSTESRTTAMNPLPPRERRRGSVGLPLANEVRIRGDDGRFCAVAEIGEIVVRGPLVFDGYLDDPDLNAASFTDGWLRTGDLGWLDADGYLFLAGRIKELINRGGEKISPVEIDIAIESLEGVRAAAAFAVPHPTLGEELVTAVVRKPGAKIEDSDIIERVRQKVGAARVPRRVYFVDEIPRTDNGKVRRAELARRLAVEAPVAAAPVGAMPAAAAPARSAAEAALCGLWSAVLDGKVVGPHDDFFLADGDSLRGVRLLTSVKAVFGVELTIETLFGDGATIAGMARAIENARAAVLHQHAAVNHTAIAPRRTRDPVPLSSTQKRIWFLSELDRGSSSYNEAQAWRLAGEIDVDALRLALHRMVLRHEILRTTYTLLDGDPRQIVHDDATIDLRLFDVGDLAPDEQPRALQRLLLAARERAFDLTRDPPLRHVLVRLNDCEHVLVSVVHHIASDRWSTAIRERELAACYNAFKAGREPVLQALAIQYPDYAKWQSESLQGPLREQLDYWKSKLAGLTALEIPTDRPRPPVISYRGARAVLDLAQPLSAALKALARREGATLFMTLLAAFQILLYRYSGQEDITVGAPIAGRSRAELEPLIGFFANTLVLRADLSGNPPFRKALARVRESALAAYGHQDVPFEKLVEELAPARDSGRNPLFQVMFALRNTPEAPFALDGLEVSRHPLQTRTAKFDLTLALRESPDGLHATWDYNTDLFDAQTIERMACHFKRLLEAIADDPDQRIGELPLLDQGERHRLLVEWNDTARPYPAARCVHELFEEHAARTADAVAVVYEGTRLTYGELDARANRLAHHLIGRGVGPDVLVGICIERSLELVVGLLGILKAGGAYVPLDPGYPKARLAFMLSDVQAPVLLTQESLLDRLPRYDGDVVCLDRDWPRINAHSTDRPSNLATARSLAYVMYTSGSTGTPKGVLTEHRSVVRLVKGADYVSLGAADTLLHLAPLSFDASTLELWGALLNGGRVVLMPPGQPALAEIGNAIRRHGVTTLWLTAGLFHVMVDERLEDLKPLRQLLAGGDVLSVKHVLEARRALPGCRLINGYGPTENTTFTCCYTVGDESELARGVPIGRPIANTRVYVLDEHGEPVPVGVSGELYAAGDGVARGYLNQPELSAEKFVADPYSPSPGARMYRTGDRVRYRPNGSLEFLGRVDHQVKIRGFRIEPGEIETTLAAHASVRHAVVLAREDKPGDKRLVACVAPARGRLVDTAALRAFVREHLPEHMHPSAYVVLKNLPLLPSGKIDRSAILAASQAPKGERPPERAMDPSPRDPVAETMCRIWRELLGVAEVGLDDDFFDLGGHSLLAVALFSRLDRAFGRTLPLATLFKAPTVRELARIYRERAEPAANMALVPITAGGTLPPVFAVPGVGGNVLCYADMARELGPEQPLYGLQSIGLDGACEPRESIEEMAAQYIRELRQVQARGPYHLMGACFGATVAFEIARQLIASGEEVAFLGLLDPSSLSGASGSRPPMRMPVALKRGLALGSFITARLRLYRDETRALGFGQRVQFLREKIAVLSEAMQRRDVFRGDPREFHQRRVTDANVRALLRYRHEPLTNGAIAVEIFTTPRRLKDAPANGRVDWRRVVGASATYHNVPGKDSGDMLQAENAKALVAVLQVRLEHARSACSASSPRC